MNTKQSLTETQLAEQMYKAMNDETELGKLFGEEVELVSEAPVTEPGQTEEEPKEKEGDNQPREGTPPGDGKGEGEEGKEPVEGKGEEGKPEGTPPEDWTSKVPEDLRPFVTKLKEEFEQTKSKANYLEQRIRSDDGRVAAYQRKAEELERKLRNLAQSKPQDSSPTAALNIESDEDFKELLESDPAFAKAFKRQIEKVAGHLEGRYEAKFKEIETMQSRAQQDAILERETALLLQAVPQAEQIMSSEYWKEFKEMAPPGIRRLAESSDHRDVVTAVQMFGSYLQATHPELVSPPQTTGTPAPATPPAAPATVAAPAAPVLPESRQRRLQQGATVPPTRMTSTVETDVDPEKLAAKYYEQIRKELGYT